MSAASSQTSGLHRLLTYMKSDNFQWYALRVESKKEQKIKAWLQAQLPPVQGNEPQAQVFVPSEKAYEIRKGKKHIKEQSFLPGYIFIQADLQDGSLQDIMKNMPKSFGRIYGFLGASGYSLTNDPVALRQAEINKILGRIDEGSTLKEDADKGFVVGESVRVIAGPFNDFVGTVQDTTQDRSKLTVIVKVFGRSTPVELEYKHVTKVA